MRVLIIEPSGNLWGSERALLDLIRSQPDIDLAVCCPPGKPLCAELRKLKVRTYETLIDDLHRKSSVHKLIAAWAILRACLLFRPDIIYLNQAGVYKIAWPAAFLLALPIVAHVRIFEDCKYLARKRVGKLRGIVAISKAVEEEVRKYGSLDSVPVERLYDAYLPVTQEKTTPSTKIRNRVIFLGRLVPIKGCHILIEASLLVEKYLRLALEKIATESDLNIRNDNRKGSCSEVICVIVGEGAEEYTSDLRNTANASSNATRIEWKGFQRDVTSAMEACSVLVCPSYREPLGRVIFEAWDAGVLPIAFAGSGGAAEVVAASGGGLLYSTQEPNALAATIAHAITMEEAERIEMVNKGRSWMAINCNLETYGARLTTFLKEASGAA